MSTASSKLVQILTFFVGTPIVYMIVRLVVQWRFVILPPASTHVTNLVVGVLFVAIWWVIWRHDVPRTPARIAKTVLALLLTVAVAVAVGNLLTSFWMPSADLVLAWSFWATLWLATTSVIWRETGAERLQRTSKRVIRCVQCGYNLTGLSEARCPECGKQYTLDEIVAVALDQTQSASYPDRSTP